MYLSDKENLIVNDFLEGIKYNPLVELVYLTRDSNWSYVITVCNFNDSRDLLNGTNKKELIKLITDNIRLFNIQNKENRLKFYSDDIASYYRLLDKEIKNNDEDENILEQEIISLSNAIILLDKTHKDIKCKKKVNHTHL